METFENKNQRLKDIILCRPTFISTPLHKVLRLTKYFAFKNYHLAKAYKLLLFYLSHLQGKDSIIIYQMGKVGSSTIFNSLSSIGLDMYIYHVHVLTGDIGRIENIYKTSSRVFNRVKISNHVIASIYLRRKLKKGLKGKKWKVITLIREPISRNISAFFQTFDLYFAELGYRYKVNAINLEDNIEELIKLFLYKFDHDVPLRWFDSHIKPVFGIDVYSYEFPKSIGYKIYEGISADLLLIKLDNINSCANDAFRKFLGIKQFNLINANISKDKAYYSAYRKFIESIKLPESHINKMYTSKYVQHFYSKEEINSFKAKFAETNPPSL